MKLRHLVSLVLVAIALPVLGQTLSWTTGPYAYDGAGNMVSVGPDGARNTYVYDAHQRLVSATLDGGQKSEAYEYDQFGNLKQMTGWRGVATFTVAPATNRLTNDGAHAVTYSATGAVLQDGLGTYTWDATDMLADMSDGPSHEYYLYSADDERIAIHDPASGWRWTIRDAEGKVLREFTSATTTGTWTWVQDYIYRGSQLVAADRPSDKGGRRDYHVDHLGTPRLMTDSSGRIIARHEYAPFGVEVTSQRQEIDRGWGREDVRKFTAHERDLHGDPGTNTVEHLDYMHARYYRAVTGRFLSVDPEMDLKANLPNPQRWNRYSYVSNNPMNKIDPDGRDEYAMDQRLSGIEDDWERDKHQLKVVGGVVGGATLAVAAPSLISAGFAYLRANPQILLGAMGWGIGMTGGAVPAGSQMHHIATNKNFAGGFTKQFQAIFEKAGMKLNNPANLMPLAGHKGIHTKAYHQFVLNTLTQATRGLSGEAYKKALTGALDGIRKMLEKDPNMVRMQ